MDNSSTLNAPSVELGANINRSPVLCHSTLYREDSVPQSNCQGPLQGYSAGN